MHLFYAPDIVQTRELPEEEARHCIRVLRLNQGDSIEITDGKGNFYHSTITAISHKRCLVYIDKVLPAPTQWEGHIHIALAPTKNMERNEWFVEKATEIGINEISFLNCNFSERRTIKPERIEKIAVSAMKQSLKAWLPEINGMTGFTDFITGAYSGQKFIAHCYAGEKVPLQAAYQKGRDAVVLIGPEGDFSPEEVKQAIARGYIPVSLGRSRLRTETAALAACHTLNLINY